MTGRKHKVTLVEKSTGTKPANPLQEAKEFWEMDKCFNPQAKFADWYEEIERANRVLSEEARQGEKNLRDH